jgi:hypothetical protein
VNVPPLIRAPTLDESFVALRQLQQLSARRPRAMTEKEIEALADEPSCMHCGGWHSRACPRIRAVEWHPNGNLAKVEYWPFAEVNWDGVLFDDVAPAEAEQVDSHA